MKLVFVTQELDPEHPALAQTTDLVRALAARVDRLVVVTRRLRWDGVPANATVETFDAGTRAGRTLAFERALLRATRGADAVLVHMVPQFALLAAPVTRARRLPLVLWYTHWHASRALAASTRVVDAVLSVDASSFPLVTPKLRAIGHAIDVERFAVSTPPGAGPLRLLALGRTARWKGLSTLLDAIALLPERPLALDLRGPSLTDDERAHRAELQARIESDPSLRGRVTLSEPVPREDVPALLAAHHLLVSPNEPRSGATLDKAVYEAAACGRVVISTNRAFAHLLGDVQLPLLPPPRDPAALADAIAAVADADRDVRAAVGATLRERVVAGHSLEHWADAVLREVRKVRSPRGTAAAGPSGR